MALTIDNESRTGAVAYVAGRVDSGAGPATLKVYSGAKPASTTTAATGTLLADVVLPDPAFSAGAAGVQLLADPGPVSGLANGTPGWYRIADSNGVGRIDGTVGVAGSGADLIVSAATIATGVSFDVQAGGNVTMPAGV